ncbi:hypothetical protein Ddc_13845 [Ditylenchus destructor]|nr:hypothetical protein Ddc_13845 [Ditylenchus destructor]
MASNKFKDYQFECVYCDPKLEMHFTNTREAMVRHCRIAHDVEEEIAKRHYQESSTHINDLADVNLMQIFQEIDSWQERLKIEQVCKKWQCVGKNLSWSNFTDFDNNDYFNMPENIFQKEVVKIKSLFERCGCYLRDLSLRYWSPQLVLPLIRMAPNLQYLSLCYVNLSSKHFRELSQILPNLKSLWLYVTDELPEGEDMTEYNLGLMECFKDMTCIEQLSINFAALYGQYSFVQFPPNLKYLYLYDVKNLDKILSWVAKGCNDLKGLCINSVRDNVNVNVYQAISQMKSLTSLDIPVERRYDVGYVFDALTELRTLQINTLDETVITAVTQYCNNLEHLTISDITGITTKKVSKMLRLATLPNFCSLEVYTHHYTEENVYKLVTELVKQLIAKGNLQKYSFFTKIKHVHCLGFCPVRPNRGPVSLLAGALPLRGSSPRSMGLTMSDHNSGSRKRPAPVELNYKTGAKESKPEHKMDGGMNISELPDMILAKIFKELQRKERLKIERVCKKWQHVGKNLSWTNYRKFDNYNYRTWAKPHVLEEVLPFLDRCGRHLRHLSFNDWSPEMILPFIRMAPNVQHLKFCKVELNDESLKELAEIVSGLKSLQFEQSLSSDERNVDEGLMECFKAMTCLECLYIRKGGGVLLGQHSFVQFPPNLKYVSLNHIQNTNQILEWVAKGCKDLKTLHVWGVYVKDNGLRAISQMKSLTYLDVMDADKDNIGYIFAALTELRAIETNTASVKMISAIAQHCKKLEHLSMIEISPEIHDSLLRLAILPNFCSFDIRTDNFRYSKKQSIELINRLIANGKMKHIRLVQSDAPLELEILFEILRRCKSIRSIALNFLEMDLMPLKICQVVDEIDESERQERELTGVTRPIVEKDDLHGKHDGRTNYRQTEHGPPSRKSQHCLSHPAARDHSQRTAREHSTMLRLAFELNARALDRQDVRDTRSLCGRLALCGGSLSTGRLMGGVSASKGRTD